MGGGGGSGFKTIFDIFCPVSGMCVHAYMYRHTLLTTDILYFVTCHGWLCCVDND